jgi:hypothetical protein
MKKNLNFALFLWVGYLVYRLDGNGPWYIALGWASLLFISHGTWHWANSPDHCARCKWLVGELCSGASKFFIRDCDGYEIDVTPAEILKLNFRRQPLELCRESPDTMRSQPGGSTNLSFDYARRRLLNLPEPDIDAIRRNQSETLRRPNV